MIKSTCASIPIQARDLKCTHLLGLWFPPGIFQSIFRIQPYAIPPALQRRFWCTLTGHPRLTQGPEGRRCNGKTGAWQCKPVRTLFERWMQTCWSFEGEIPTQRKCLTSLNLLANRRCSIQSKGTKRKTAIYSLFHSHGSLKLMQECVCWTVCAKCVQPMWHLTCTQQQLAEIRVITQFWSNLLGLLIGFHRVPSIHASTNVIPTGFVSRCRRSLSIWSISDACTCRVQASVRLLKMLRHIIGKVKMFAD